MTATIPTRPPGGTRNELEEPQFSSGDEWTLQSFVSCNRERLHRHSARGGTAGGSNGKNTPSLRNRDSETDLLHHRSKMAPFCAEKVVLISTGSMKR